MTYAIAAQEGNGVHVSDCPCFVTSGNSQGISAKDMWLEMKEVFSLMYFTVHGTILINYHLFCSFTFGA